MVDNLEIILPFLQFESEDDFYFLQILKRKKDQTEKEKSEGRSNNSRTIKTYYINSQEYLLNKYDEIKKLCHLFNARANINLNKRSYKKTSLYTNKLLAEYMFAGKYDITRNLYDKACGKFTSAKKKLWIVDIDSLEELQNVSNYINTLLPKVDNKIVTIIPSKSGCHLITTPFNLHEFKKKFNHIDVQKNNPTNLYIP